MNSNDMDNLVVGIMNFFIAILGVELAEDWDVSCQDYGPHRVYTMVTRCDTPYDSIDIQEIGEKLEKLLTESQLNCGGQVHLDVYSVEAYPEVDPSRGTSLYISVST
jgi:hypothetical protein